MPRRVSLPGASELFRRTQPAEELPPDGQPAAPAVEELPPPGRGDAGGVGAAAGDASAHPPTPRRGSGRVRHDEKITVYVSSDELLALERARLALRAEHGMAVDRGRIVREAISLVVADLAEHGPESDLVRRLSQP